jgi:anti-sigma factor RsiW
MDAHPTADELAAYHDGELPPEQEERVRGHLLACAECAELLLDFDALRNDPDFGRQRPAPAAELDAVWQAVRAHAAPPPSTVTSASPPALRERPRRSDRSRWAQALAAALLIGVIGLSLWVAALRRTVSELSQPQLNAPVLDLQPSPERGSVESGTTLKLPADVKVFTLVLNPASPRDFPSYAVAIERAGGGKVWSGEGLEKNRYGSFSLAVPRSLVPDGTYTIRLFGKDGVHNEPLGEYSIDTTP